MMEKWMEEFMLICARIENAEHKDEFMRAPEIK